VLVVTPREASGDRDDPSLFLSKALSIGTAPAFQVDVTSAVRMTPTMLEKRAVVVLNDTPFPPALAGGALKKFVEQGGGVLVVLGEHSTWPSNDAALLPGTLTGTVDRPDGRGGALGFIDYSHRCSRSSGRRRRLLERARPPLSCADGDADQRGARTIRRCAAAATESKTGLDG
jgi:hypothetical protein